jgi:hypothetical protein
MAAKKPRKKPGKRLIRTPAKKPAVRAKKAAKKARKPAKAARGRPRKTRCEPGTGSRDETDDDDGRRDHR